MKFSRDEIISVIDKKKKNFQAGFTIVEVVVVIFLMLVAIYPAARVIASALEASNEEQYLTHAAFLAQMKLEHLRATENCYSDVGGVCPNQLCDDVSDPACTFGGGTNRFSDDFDQAPANCTFPAPFQKYECNITDTNAAATFLKEIQVQVWYDKDSDGVWDAGEPGVTLQTMLARRSPISG